ncbi:hypothetical protein EV195_104168 [Tenacibaculum skagerrakense]|uniref:Uncharacterized protein n=1 Tax=Tenacibaculum skagerrakense TaxID=186571 RepID=A0A4R2NUT4_9FLAO|nr:hypothetical protein [Tenacibaculum skagerrakense]TCP25135.1 hypothetical protein EV195_104168 [Tenacibaculum skagerrakense]
MENKDNIEKMAKMLILLSKSQTKELIDNYFKLESDFRSDPSYNPEIHLKSLLKFKSDYKKNKQFYFNKISIEFLIYFMPIFFSLEISDSILSNNPKNIKIFYRYILDNFNFEYNTSIDRDQLKTLLAEKMDEYLALGDIIHGKNKLIMNIHEAVSISLFPLVAIIEGYGNFTLIILDMLEKLYKECLPSN